jgi:hypothetical protein
VKHTRRIYMLWLRIGMQNLEASGITFACYCGSHGGR